MHMRTCTLEKFTTQCTFTLYTELDTAKATELQLALSTTIDDFESEFSRFLPHSTLSQLNRWARLRLSPRFLTLFRNTQDIVARTHGAFHPCVALEKKWYGTSFDENFHSTAREIGPTSLSEQLADYLIHDTFDDTYALLPGYTLDFGGIAKGFLVDILGEQLKAAWYHNFIINFGGDILVSGNKWDQTPYYIEIDDGKWGDIGMIDLSIWSISTSGNYKRTRQKDASNYHHIITPSTWANSRDLISVSVIWPNTTITDSFATAVMTWNAADGIQLLIDNQLAGLLIDKNGTLYMTPQFEETYHLGKE